MKVCNAVNGVKIMHGNRGYFHSEKQPVFSAIYRVMEAYQIGKNPYTDFLLPAIAALADDEVKTSSCGKESEQILEKARQILINYYFS